MFRFRNILSVTTFWFQMFLVAVLTWYKLKSAEPVAGSLFNYVSFFQKSILITRRNAII